MKVGQLQIENAAIFQSEKAFSKVNHFNASCDICIMEMPFIFSSVSISEMNIAEVMKRIKMELDNVQLIFVQEI